MKDACIRVRLRVFGRVQGVGFRRSMQVQARELGVSGWAKNLLDGSVEVVLEGREERVEILVSWAEKGPAFARVDRVEAAAEPCEGKEQDFSIRAFGF